MHTKCLRLIDLIASNEKLFFRHNNKNILLILYQHVHRKDKVNHSTVNIKRKVTHTTAK